MSEFRRRLLMQSKSSLPSEYQRVEYIESQGSQYMTLDYIVQENDEIYLRLEQTKFVGDKQQFQTSDGQYGLWFSITNDNSVYLRWGSNYSSNFTVYNPTIVVGNKKNYNIDGKNYPVTFIKMPNSRLNLFAAISPTTGEVANPSFSRFFDFHISENGEKKLHLIPCYRRSDGEIGLYDIINKKFYTNLGTGEFLKGLDV